MCLVQANEVSTGFLLRVFVVVVFNWDVWEKQEKDDIIVIITLKGNEKN